MRAVECVEYVALATFNSSGNIPWSRESLIISLRHFAILELTCFIARMEESAVDLFSNDLMIKLISSAVVGVSVMFVKHRLFGSSWGSALGLVFSSCAMLQK